ncbi:DUF4177 domain-containing protein [Roseibium sp.]|uniref:DUF4177 domain-containing protein n=1 Tax=Roseibium sp. TaxID=1936156 RepID=UPI003D0CF950
MRKFEYKAVPAPNTGTKARGVKTTEDRFALSMTETLNEMASEGWEYVRAETLPCTERKGLTGSQQTYQNILVFRRLEAEALPLDRTTSRPLRAVEEVREPSPKPEPPVHESEPVEDAPRLSSRPPEGGRTPSIRAVED